MAVVRGVKEKLHLPIYDSLFVRPKEQLREVDSSSVLKFFVDVQGKTKLETNMQSASLLPHWNTFEARALRVVVSDLPTVLPDEIVRCMRETDEMGDCCALLNLQGCLDQLCNFVNQEKQFQTEKQHHLDALASYAFEFEKLAEKSNEIRVDLETCIGLFRTLSDEAKPGSLLDLQHELQACRPDLLNVLQKTRIPLSKPAVIERFVKKLESLPTTHYEKVLQKQFKDARLCFDDFIKMADLIKKIQEKEYINGHQAVDFLLGEKSRAAFLAQIKECLSDVEQEICGVTKGAARSNARSIQESLGEKLRNKQAIPIEEQLSGNGTTILSKLIYNSITTFSVGEKIMMQMPTWFFPSGGGPYSDDGNVVTHGFPSPEATFRFSEPVLIDTQQNFRVEIEIPEASELTDLQRLYGPFFIWVVLDGYMVRDVQ